MCVCVCVLMRVLSFSCDPACKEKRNERGGNINNNNNEKQNKKEREHTLLTPSHG